MTHPFSPGDPFDSINEDAKELVHAELTAVVGNWDEYTVGKVSKRGGRLTVELHSSTERKKVTIEIDANP